MPDVLAHLRTGILDIEELPGGNLPVPHPDVHDIRGGEGPSVEDEDDLVVPRTVRADPLDHQGPSEAGHQAELLVQFTQRAGLRRLVRLDHPPW